ncbi:MAG: ATP-binding protein [Acidimicrobiales bacterium]
MPDTHERLEGRLERAREKISILERMIEDNTRSLYLAKEEISAKSRFLESILRSMDSAVIVTDADARIVSAQGTTAGLTGTDVSELLGESLWTLISRTGEVVSDDDLVWSGEASLATADGSLPVLVATSALVDDEGQTTGAVCVATDISERRQLELELRHSQKLESVGQLAAGVAHEINTPIQYIGDSVHFLGDVIDDLLRVAEAHGALRTMISADAATNSAINSAIAAVDEAEEEADLEFIAVEGPAAVRRTLEGVERVSTIVKAMKQFSHPGSEQHAPEDLNEMIDTTLIVARNEYKYIADVDFVPAEIPQVVCKRGDLSQVLLNIVVNAAHAIADRVEGTPDRGTITIRCVEEGGGVCLTIADTGGGIPAAIRDRIFDPFFTTKEPGRGTGQGLAISRSVVVDGHNGKIGVDVEEGVGTTFRIWLPSEPPT